MNMFFTIFEDNGKIVRSGTCSEEDYLLQNPGNLNMLPEFSDPNKNYIRDNIVLNFPIQPEYQCFFNYQTYEWEKDYPKQSDLMKSQRDNLLYTSDWTQIPGNPLTAAQQLEWAVYRQELRDITNQPGYPFNVIWPTQPE